MRALVIEDSERLRRSLAHGLEGAGWAVDSAADGEEGLAFLGSYPYDAVVLDLMLPKLSGLEVLRRARRGGAQAPILILSAMDRVEERVRSLEAGADDYLVKPFAFDELRARLQALVRRRHQVRNPRLTLGELEVDLAARRVTRHGVPLHLTPGELAVLEVLLLRRGVVVSQAQILDHLYASKSEVSSNVVEVLVSGLRKKLRAAGGEALIQTRRGYGYLIE
jgi:two-component system copper resistance phosphate regulon response regulator CusR